MKNAAGIGNCSREIWSVQIAFGTFSGRVDARRREGFAGDGMSSKREEVEHLNVVDSFFVWFVSRICVRLTFICEN